VPSANAVAAKHSQSAGDAEMNLGGAKIIKQLPSKKAHAIFWKLNLELFSNKIKIKLIQ
jgi:hypothetical protein